MSGGKGTRGRGTAEGRWAWVAERSALSAQRKTVRFMNIRPPMNRLIPIVFAFALAGCSSRQEASAAGDVVSTAERDLAHAISQSDALKTAQAAIDAGHPWRATQIVAPVVRDPKKRTPAALIVAARAAAGWNGWAEVEKLL